jgi:hypothetical protein
MDRFMSKVDKAGPIPDYRPDLGPCWLWTGFIADTGYGKFTVGATSPRGAHRWLWEQINGPASSKLHIDHLCRVRRCVNPDHLELVTHSENIRRGAHPRYNSLKTHCPQGHPYDEANTYWNVKGTSRSCRTCERERNRRRRANRESISTHIDRSGP